MDIFGVLLVLTLVIIFYGIHTNYFEKFDQSNQIDKIYQFSNMSQYNLLNQNNRNNGNNKNNYKNVNKNVNKNRKKNKFYFKDTTNTNEDLSKYLDKMLEYNDVNKNLSISEKKINPYFQEIQFHQDYRDTMNGFNIMCNQKNIFNKTHEPLLNKNINEEERNDVNGIINKFIQSLNSIVENKVGSIATQQLNSWQDNLPLVTPDNDIIKKKSSWEQYNEELGLPSTIYPDPAEKSKINLIKIDQINKYETLKELKYSVYLILQKENVTDQMVVKISFVINKEDINLEREFFDKNKNKFETQIVIEEISIIGFLILTGAGKPKTHREKFYDYDGFNEGRMISEKEVIKQLNDKKKQIEKEFISSM